MLPVWRPPRARWLSDASASSPSWGRALDAVRAGSGTAVLVAGEAGLGKTRLASELAARARARRDADTAGTWLARAEELIAAARHAAAEAAAVTPNVAGWRAARIGATPLARQLELLPQRARLELAPPDAGSPDRKQGLAEILGSRRGRRRS